MKPLEDVINKVNDILNLDIRENTKSRKDLYPLGRQVVMYVAQNNFNYSPFKAGDIFQKNRATALHALKKITGLIKLDKKFLILFADVLFYIPDQKFGKKEIPTYLTKKLIICPNCKGEGQIENMEIITTKHTLTICPYCGGSGRLEKVTWLHRCPSLLIENKINKAILSPYLIN